MLAKILPLETLNTHYIMVLKTFFQNTAPLLMCVYSLFRTLFYQFSEKKDNLSYSLTLIKNTSHFQNFSISRVSLAKTNFYK